MTGRAAARYSSPAGRGSSVRQVSIRSRMAIAYSSAGVADVVLQHSPAPELVGPGRSPDRRLDSAAGQARRLGSPPRRVLHQSWLEYAVGDDPLIAVDVAQEQFDRPSALTRPTRSACHSCGVITRGTRSTEKTPLVTVDTERHAGLVDPPPASVLDGVQLVLTGSAEESDHVRVDRTRAVAGPDCFITGSNAVPP